MANFIKEWKKSEIDKLARSFERYGFLVNTLKYALPVAAVVLLAVTFLTAELDESERIVLEQVVGGELSPDKMVMKNPRFHGLDSRDHPYSVFAETARQVNPQEVQLEGINADITTDDSSWASMVGEFGVYYIEREYLQLIGDAGIFVTDSKLQSYDIKTLDVSVDVGAGVISSSSEVRAKGEIGDLYARGFEASAQNQKISFKGPVKLVIKRK